MCISRPRTRIAESFVIHADHFSNFSEMSLGLEQMWVRFLLAVLAFLMILGFLWPGFHFKAPSKNARQTANEYAGIPLPNYVIGKRASFQGCSSRASLTEIEIAIKALTITDSGADMDFVWCARRIVIPFKEASMMDMLHFTTYSYSKEYGCRNATRKVFAKGHTRGEFVRLIREYLDYALLARQHRICEGYDLKYTRSEVYDWLEHDRVVNAAVYYLTNIAYRNYFRNALQFDDDLQYQTFNLTK